jgi:hypothetical protein
VGALGGQRRGDWAADVCLHVCLLLYDCVCQLDNRTQYSLLYWLSALVVLLFVLLHAFYSFCHCSCGEQDNAFGGTGGCCKCIRRHKTTRKFTWIVCFAAATVRLCAAPVPVPVPVQGSVRWGDADTAPPPPPLVCGCRMRFDSFYSCH